MGAETAHRVTYDKDVYYPSGTLDGGSKPSSVGILMDIQTLKLSTRTWWSECSNQKHTKGSR